MKIKILLLLLAISFSSLSQELKVEPENWWAGMKYNSIQLLVYGNDINDAEVDFSYPGLKLDSVVKVENPNYLFLYVTLANDIKPGKAKLKLKGKGKYEFPILEREKGSAQRQGFDPSDVMYLITPDRFVNGNPDNDVIEGMLDSLGRDHKFGRHGGDIQGMLDNLDYIEKMGFTAIWLNPVLENDMYYASYHGYATTDFYKVDPRYGSNEEYRNLIVEAGKRGIKMIMDMIVNHSGSEHWFVKDPPEEDWINSYEKFEYTSHRRFTIQDIHASEFDKKKFSNGWFSKTMPDLNQQNPRMAEYLIQNTLWWIEYSGLAGIRMDTYPYPDKDFMTDWTCAVMQEYPDFNIVGEEWVDKPAVVSYWQSGKKNHDGYQSCLPSLMDFPIQAALKEALVAEEKKYGSGLILLYEKLAQDFLYPDPYNLVVFPDNHDMDRFFTQVGEDFDLFKIGLSYILTTRGIPQIYYGTEVLMKNSEHPGDHGIIRTDFPGGWPNDPKNVFTGTGLSDREKEAMEFTSKLINWRKEKEVIHNGKLMQFSAENGVYVYFRYNSSETVMIVLNKNDEVTELDLDRFSEIIKDQKSGTEIISEIAIDLNQDLSIPPKSSMIIELR